MRLPLRLPGAPARNVIAFLLTLAAAWWSSDAQAEVRPDILWMRGGHSDSVRSVAYSPDGTLLASGGQDWTVKIWRVSDRQLLRTLVPTDAPVSKIAFSPNGAWLAVGTVANGHDTYALKIFDTVSFVEVFHTNSEGEEASVGDVVFSPDGARLAVAVAEGIELRRTSDWQLERTLFLPDSEDAWFRSLQFSSDSTKLVCGLESDDHAVIALWRAGDGALLWSTNLTGNNSGPVVFAPNGSELLCGVSARWPGENDRLQVRSALNGTLLRTWTATNVSHIALSPDGAKILLGRAWEPWQVWNWAGEAVAYEIETPDFYVSAVFSPDSQFIATGGGLFQPAAFGVLVWRSADGQRQPGFDEHSGKIDRVLFSPDSTLLISQGTDDTLRFWQADTGQKLFTLPGYRLNALAFSPDGTRLLVGEGFGQVRLLRPADGSVITNLARTSNAEVGPASGAAFSPDGRFVAVRYAAPSIMNLYGEVDVFDVATGILVFSQGIYSSGPVFFSADGTQLQAPRNGRLAQWRASDWQALEAPFFSGPWGVRSPDDRFRAWHMSGTLGGPPGGLLLNGSLLETGGGSSYNSPPVTAFAPDSGTLLVGLPRGNTLKFFGSGTLKMIRAFDGEVAGGAPFVITDGDDREIGRYTGATAIGFSPDARLFAYGRIDGTVVVARNPFGAPLKTSLAQDGNQIRVSWQGRNLRYQLQQRSSLTTDWQNLGNVTTNTSAVLSPSGSSLFFRVQSLEN